MLVGWGTVGRGEEDCVVNEVLTERCWGEGRRREMVIER